MNERHTKNVSDFETVISYFKKEKTKEDELLLRETKKIDDRSIGKRGGLSFGCYYPPTVIPINRPTYLPLYLPRVIPTYCYNYLQSYLPTYRYTYLQSYVHTYLPTAIPTYSHTFIPIPLLTYLGTYCASVSINDIDLFGSGFRSISGNVKILRQFFCSPKVKPFSR